MNNPISVKLDTLEIDQIVSSILPQLLDINYVHGSENYLIAGEYEAEILRIGNQYLIGYIFWKDDLDQQFYYQANLPLSLPNRN